MTNNTNNPATEITLLVISIALIAAMTILFVLGKIDYVGAIPFLTIVAGLWGVNSAFKAPSPSQQAQIGAQQQSLQDVISQLMNVLPVLFQVHSHPVPTTPTPVTIVPPPPPSTPVAVAQQAPMQAAQPIPMAALRVPPVPPAAYTPPPTVARSFGDTSGMPTV